MASSSALDEAAKPDMVLFARGVLAILDLWPALRLAVSESWGGPESTEKRRWLASELIDQYDSYLSKPHLNPLPDAHYLEEMLLQVMSDEFETVLEDGSAEKVAGDLVKLWGDLTEGRNAEVDRLEGLVRSLKGKKVQVQVQENDDEESGSEDEDGDWTSEDEEEEVPRLVDTQKKNKEPEVDEDGFTTVKRKR